MCTPHDLNKNTCYVNFQTPSLMLKNWSPIFPIWVYKSFQICTGYLLGSRGSFCLGFWLIVSESLLNARYLAKMAGGQKMKANIIFWNYLITYGNYPISSFLWGSAIQLFYHFKIIRKSNHMDFTTLWSSGRNLFLMNGGLYEA